MARLLGRILRWTFTGLVFLIPIFLHLTWLLVFMAVAGIASLLVGFPTATDRISDQWTDRVMGYGVPLQHRNTVKQGADAFAIFYILTCWLVIIFLGYVIASWVF